MSFKKLHSKKGFSLIEMMFAMSIGLMLTTGVITSMVFHLKAFGGSERNMAAALASNNINSILVYGTDNQPGLREAVAETVDLVEGGWGWRVAYKTSDGGPTHRFFYLAGFDLITDNAGNVLAENVQESDPQLDNDGVLRINFKTRVSTQGEEQDINYKTRVAFRN